MKSILVLALVVASAVAHSFISVPTTRTNQGQSETGCRGPSCVGPCDGGTPRVVGTVQRGQSLNIKWPRNNHPGGFIRFAWAPTGQSGSHEAFDSRVHLITCHERGTQAGGACAPGSASDPNGGDPVSASNTAGHCSADVTVPSWATDGQWTLQWAWFGGGFALGDYYSCVDYTVSGGAAVTTGVPAPTFIGGDYANQNDRTKCKTFNTDALHRCRNEPCDNPVFNGIQNIPPAGVTGGNPPPPVTPTVPPTPGGNGNCYASAAGAKNLNGPIAPVCGVNGPNNRCADNLCCSRFGYCGATPEYCSDNQGDWRLTPCTGSGGLCYSGTSNLNLDGPLSVNSRCGNAARGSRCPDGQCCSRYGYCGTTGDHCNQNQGDWRLVTCTGSNNISPRDAIYSNSTLDDAAPDYGNAGQIALGLLSAAALAL